MWRYLDYLVKSFNDDKPYSQFVMEQLAGDEMTPRSDEAMIATILGWDISRRARL